MRFQAELGTERNVNVASIILDLSKAMLRMSEPVELHRHERTSRRSRTSNRYIPAGFPLDRGGIR